MFAENTQITALAAPSARRVRIVLTALVKSGRDAKLVYTFAAEGQVCVCGVCCGTQYNTVSGENEMHIIQTNATRTREAEDRREGGQRKIKNSNSDV